MAFIAHALILCNPTRSDRAEVRSERNGVVGTFSSVERHEGCCSRATVVGVCLAHGDTNIRREFAVLGESSLLLCVVVCLLLLELTTDGTGGLLVDRFGELLHDGQLLGSGVAADDAGVGGGECAEKGDGVELHCSG